MTFKIDLSSNVNLFSYSQSPSNSEALKQATEMLDKKLQFLIDCGSHLNPKARKLYVEHLMGQHKLAVDQLSELAKRGKVTSEGLIEAARNAVSELDHSATEFIRQGSWYEAEKESVNGRLDDFDRELSEPDPSFESFAESYPPSFGPLDEVDPFRAPLSPQRFSEVEKTAVGAVVQELVDTAEILKRPLRNQLVEQVTTQGNEILKELRDLEQNGMNHLREDRLKFSLVMLKMNGLVFLQTLSGNPLDQEKRV